MPFLLSDREPLLYESLDIKKLAEKIYKFLAFLFRKHSLFFHKQTSHAAKHQLLT
jgi:hypothetical protein